MVSQWCNVYIYSGNVQGNSQLENCFVSCSHRSLVVLVNENSTQDYIATYIGRNFQIVSFTSMYFVIVTIPFSEYILLKYISVIHGLI